MTAELLQFGIMVVGFCVALALWLAIVYIPRRTMERWEGPKPESRDPAPETLGPAAEFAEIPGAPKGR